MENGPNMVQMLKILRRIFWYSSRVQVPEKVLFPEATLRNQEVGVFGQNRALRGILELLSIKKVLGGIG